MNEVGKVTAIDGLHLRQHPDANSRILCTLRHDQVVKIEDKHGNWFQVRTAWGERGYLYSQYVTVIPKGPTTPVEPALPPPLSPPSPPLLQPDWLGLLYVLGGLGALTGLALLWGWFNP